MKPAHFWLSMLLVALAFAAAAFWLFPYGRLGMESADARERGWLLILWTGGLLAICFGGAGLLGGLSPIRFTDVADHGSVMAAVEAKRDSIRKGFTGFYNFAGWLVGSGLSLIAIYFVAWLTL